MSKSSLRETLLRMAAIFLVAVPHLCHADDWTVNGKTYLNVTVAKPDLDADTVSIRFNDTKSQPQTAQLKLSDLPAERVAKIRSEEQEMLTLVALQVYFESSGPISRFERAKRERPDAVKELSKHPLTLIGTVLYGCDGGYLVQLQKGLNENSAIVQDSKTNYSFLLMPSQSYQEKQKISLKVYSASYVEFDGVAYQCFSDNPTKAYNLSHDLY